VVRRPATAGRARGIASALLALCASACIDASIPARPDVSPPSDGGAGVTQLASETGCGSINLVVSGETLYWTERATGTVKSVPTLGGLPTVIERGQNNPGPIAVDGEWVFWANAGSKNVMKKIGAGVPAIVFVPPTTVPEVLGGENDINALLASSGTLYFGRYTYAIKVPTGGGKQTVIGQSPDSDLGKPGAFAVDGNYLYQTELDHAAISRELTDGTQNGLLEGPQMIKQPYAPDRIAVSQGMLLTDAIDVAYGYVIWADGSVIKGKGVGQGESDAWTVMAVAAGFNDVTGFVVSGNAIYFGEAVTNDIEVAPLNLDPTTDAAVPPMGTVIATNQSNAGQFAADDKNVYWRTDQCKIMKMAK
jgi:hypothetical protein